MPMVLHIKNMVCDRCIAAVRRVLEAHGLHSGKVGLGTAEVEELTDPQRAALAEDLHRAGFELLEDRRKQLVETARNAVIGLVHRSGDEERRIKHSAYLAERTGVEYAYLSRLFSETEGITLEHYIILQKIERVKELLAYGDRTLSDIADEMGYSSVAALSAQFRKIAGMTPTEFRRDGGPRLPLDRVGKI